MRYTRMSRPGRWLFALFALPLLFDSCASNYFYNKVIARNRKDFLYELKDLSAYKRDPDAPKLPAPWFESQSYETVSIASIDGLTLVGYWLPASSPSGKTIILAHGYSSRAIHMSEFARFCHEELGYNVLVPDARGHGASEGDYIGFGWPERLDFVRWINWAISRTAPNEAIVLHGISMGGATVLMAGGEALPGNVKAIVEDCGYTSVDDELSYQIKRMYNLPREPFIPETSRLTKKKAGYSFEEASALEQVRKAKVPILFIHGEADTFVPVEMVRRLYEACPGEKELLVVPGAGHGLSWSVDKASYTATLKAFLRGYMEGLSWQPRLTGSSS